MQNKVYAISMNHYDIESIISLLPEILFDGIKPYHKIVMKPNWVAGSHQDNTNEWEQVITHPDVITAVIIKLLKYLGPGGKIFIVDSPEIEV